MGFLSNFKFGGGSPAKTEEVDTPTRNRTFSATAFREAELARESAVRAHYDAIRAEASSILSPALAPVAEQLMQRQSEDPSFDPSDSIAPNSDGFDEGPITDAYQAPQIDAADTQAAESAVLPIVEIQDNPLPWDEAVGWLSQRSAESRNFVAQYWNWDYDLRVLEFLVRQPDIDAGVAAGVFWLTAAAEDHFPWSDEPAMDEVSRHVANLTDIIGRRFSDGDFYAMSHGFDDSWDCERLKERLEDLYGESRIEWSPASLPTSSHAAMLGFDDIPEGERAEVIEFLGRFGVR
nr:hypothetical protein [uncultured Sphingomonas sp.]